MAPAPKPPVGWRGFIRIVGPGIVVAATGVGAGDMVAAAKAGATFGVPLLWTALLGAILKYTLAEGIARWQLATRTTVLEGWVASFGRPVQIYFLLYLLLWTVIVSAALMSACGLAAHALVPSVSVTLWGAAHGLAALLFVWVKGYGVVERAMKVAIGMMFVAIVGSAIVQAPPLGETVRGLVIPSLPPGSIILVLGVVGGVGGTLTLLSYNYWMREKGFSGVEWLGGVRFDLAIGYLLTGLFGVALILMGGVVLFPNGDAISGAKGVLVMAQVLGRRFGRAGELVFLIGFWSAVATSLLGVWQGVPYMFGNYIGLLRGADRSEMQRSVATRGRLYRSYLLFMTFPPMLLLLLDKPVWLVIAYAAIGSLFMPFLAATLLVMNNRLDRLRNGLVSNLLLASSLLLFAYLAITEIATRVFGRG